MTPSIERGKFFNGKRLPGGSKSTTLPRNFKQETIKDEDKVKNPVDWPALYNPTAVSPPINQRHPTLLELHQQRQAQMQQQQPSENHRQPANHPQQRSPNLTYDRPPANYYTSLATSRHPPHYYSFHDNGRDYGRDVYQIEKEIDDQLQEHLRAELKAQKEMAKTKHQRVLKWLHSIPENVVSSSSEPEPEIVDNQYVDMELIYSEADE